MAIGRKPPSIFTRAISFAAKKKMLAISVSLPSSIILRSLVRDFQKKSPALPFELLIRSLKFGNQSCPDRLPNHSEKTLLLCTPQTHLRKKHQRFPDLGYLGSEIMLTLFLSVIELIAVVCLGPFLLDCSRKNKKYFRKTSQ